jgi:hypothetical protein
VGLFILTPEPPPVRTLIQRLVDTPEGDIRARAEVKSRNPPKGTRVKIVAMGQEDRERFARWLKAIGTWPRGLRIDSMTPKKDMIFRK